MSDRHERTVSQMHPEAYENAESHLDEALHHLRGALVADIPEEQTVEAVHDAITETIVASGRLDLWVEPDNDE